MGDTPVPAAVIWFEIVVEDFDRAKAFYGGLLGWSFELLEGYAEEYWAFAHETTGGIAGALTKASQARRPGGGGVVYAMVPELEAAVARAVELGAVEVQGPTLITETAGSFALVADPDGNHLGLFVP